MKKPTIVASICGSLIFASALCAQVTLNQTPTRVIGQLSIRPTSPTPNLAEGKDLNSPNGVAVDNSSGPAGLYVADSNNNRVLGWRNAASFANGAPADIVLGQPDFVTTEAGGPGTQFSVGLSIPVAVAVDSQGDVYVADAANNRILRFPRPYDQAEDRKQPDMVIGQQNFNSNLPNPSGLNASSIQLSSGGRTFRSGLTFDAEGNLWFSDSGNNRVLRYPVSALQRGQNQPAADRVLGQPSFTATLPNNTGPGNKQILTNPSGLAFDSEGNLFVCESFNRVLVYSRLQQGNGALASRIMGVLQQGQNNPPTPVNEISLGANTTGGRFPPEGVFTIGAIPFVVDTPNNRILRFDPVAAWPNEATQFSPTARQVIGQSGNDFTSSKVNRGQAEASNASLSNPVQAAVANNEVYVTDNGNNRVLAFPISGGSVTVASRVLGQNEFFQSAPNNIDGRELFLFAGTTGVGNGVSSDGAGIAIDNSSNPPRLYIADTYNNRILGYRDARNVKPGDRADIVLGQRDFQRAMINNPTNDFNQVTASGLFWPSGVAVDAFGNLYVADSGNGRVLRYSQPFDQPAPGQPDLVLGQSSFFIKVIDPSPRNMARPYGLAFTTQGHLLVSDIFHNRVLLFRKPDGGDFSNGQSADKVFGQPDFVTANTFLNSPNRMVAPHGIATDTDDRLYVADTGNNRLLIYDSVTVGDFDPFPANQLQGISSPHGVAVSARTGEIWVTSVNQGLIYRLQNYLTLLIDPRSDFQISSSRPVGVALDGYGNLLIADGYNRVSFHYPGMSVANGGNLLSRIAPYTYVTLKPVANATFGEATLSFTDLPGTPPMPDTLADIQVLVNDVPAPIKTVSPGQIDFIMPPLSTNVASIVVTRQSTSQILAAATATAAPYAPALFTVNPDGNGQVVAKNPDGTANGPSDRVGRSQTISLFGTGFGIPPDVPVGSAPADKVPGSGVLQVVIGTRVVPAENITYFGLAPGMVGVWQIDVKVPDATPPDAQVPVAVAFNSFGSTNDSSGRRTTYIAVKP
ncbi:MAG TPA: hypothetical protein VM120_22580 [Bryobacteraceae bacterium]|nr:hypothetical protein [Bryobacteraceae bacterium]